MEEQNELLNKLEDAYIFYRESKHKFEQIKRDYESNLNKFNYNVKSIDSTLYQLKGGYINIDEVEKSLTNLIGDKNVFFVSPILQFTILRKFVSFVMSEI